MLVPGDVARDDRHRDDPAVPLVRRDAALEPGVGVVALDAVQLHAVRPPRREHAIEGVAHRRVLLGEHPVGDQRAHDLLLAPEAEGTVHVQHGATVPHDEHDVRGELGRGLRFRRRHGRAGRLGRHIPAAGVVGRSIGGEHRGGRVRLLGQGGNHPRIPARAQRVVAALGEEMRGRGTRKPRPPLRRRPGARSGLSATGTRRRGRPGIRRHGHQRGRPLRQSCVGGNHPRQPHARRRIRALPLTNKLRRIVKPFRHLDHNAQVGCEVAAVSGCKICI
jgi:hypothetical protein